MKYHALACDYDGTLATRGEVEQECLEALERLRDSGRKLVMVTGRQVADLLAVFPAIALFDLVVAENGGVLYDPANREERPLCEPPPPEFIDLLQRRGIDYAVGRVIVATWTPNQIAVIQAIQELGLELQLIFNKGAVMVLPSGINKATGLLAALGELGLSAHNVVGAGDAENDHAFLDLCEFSVAVANALPFLKKRADLVTRGERGAGITELAGRLLASDLGDLQPARNRHLLTLGNKEDGTTATLRAFGQTILISGTSGSGKSTFAAGILEQLAAQGYQFCIIDPEGDYSAGEGMVVLGDRQTAASPDMIVKLLENPQENCAVNLLGVPIGDRPRYLQELLPKLRELVTRTGRPHWLVLDEAHHLVPATPDGVPALPAPELSGVILITVHPDHVSRSALTAVDVVVAIGDGPDSVFSRFASVTGDHPRPVGEPRTAPGEAVAWFRRTGDPPFRIKATAPQALLRRHSRKYADGMLGPDKSFYFRGPEGKLNLRAHNLTLFVQLAEGVDDETWRYHLGRGDISRWLRTSIKDDALAAVAEGLEGPGVSPRDSRDRIREAIEERYTAPV